MPTMKMHWIMVVGLALPLLQAKAQPSAPDPQGLANPANREAALKSGHLSPRERAELLKAAGQSADGGASFLAGNKARLGVISLPSGVQYRILAAGNGRKPTDAARVRCRYEGKLVDGTTFDKSDDRQPVTMPVAGFVPGLQEALKLMPAGSKWEVVVPPQLAFASQGHRSAGPNGVVIYVVELVSVL
jgi:FKBP-type peptidyl-prolyl cis-trans isomerase FklB